MIIYPKISEKIDGIEGLKQYIKKYKGIEIQMLEWEKNEKLIDIVKIIKNEIPEIEEITIHPPLKEYFNFEIVTYSNFENEIERLKCVIEASKQFNIKMNLLYHTKWSYLSWEKSGAIERICKMLNSLQGTNVNILLENIFSVTDKEECEVLKIVKTIDNPHLKMCIDICHLHVQANIFEIPFNKFLFNYLNKKDCEKCVHQIHFSATLNNDGFKDIKNTHGRKHITIKDLEDDYHILEKYGIDNKIIVTEICEDDYYTRLDEIEEIKMLESLNLQ